MAIIRVCCACGVKSKHLEELEHNIEEEEEDKVSRVIAVLTARS